MLLLLACAALPPRVLRAALPPLGAAWLHTHTACAVQLLLPGCAAGAVLQQQVRQAAMIAEKRKAEEERLMGALQVRAYVHVGPVGLCSHVCMHTCVLCAQSWCAAAGRLGRPFSV